MLTIKTWCLPQSSEEKLNDLHNAIVEAVVSISETAVKNESEMLNLFPSDLMSYGLGTEIVIEITKVPALCNQKTRNKLAKVVALAVKEIFPKATVECEAIPINHNAGFYSIQK